ncbi:MAG: sterol desaturase family protein [Bacteroidota bacterium]|nr:sterol desaturase family protein [Bacteroidota bacterium]
MPKNFVSNKDESVRMFRDAFLDKISRVHFSVPLYLYVPVILICIYRAFFIFQTNFFVFIGLVVIGFFLWTFTEYNLHRFIFHYQPKSEIGKRLHFITHGVHHDYPNDSMRLVMVPAISMPLCVIFYTIFFILFGANLVDSFFVGYVIGYLFYDLSHYALHHANFKNKFWQQLKQNHMKHHYMEPDRGYGVSTTFWDHVYQSRFRKEDKKIEEVVEH